MNTMMNATDLNAAYIEKKINLKESLDVNFWCDELNLRAEELKEIVKLVGPMVHDVRVHLAKKLLLAWNRCY